MTPAQIVVLFSAEPPDRLAQSDPAQRRRARAAELFEMVCLKYGYAPETLAILQTSEVARLLTTVDSSVKVEPELVAPALAEWLKDRSKG